MPQLLPEYLMITFSNSTGTFTFVTYSSFAPPGSPEYDKLGKIRPIIHMQSTAFYEVFSPQKNLSVDEAMVPFK